MTKLDAAALRRLALAPVPTAYDALTNLIAVCEKLTDCADELDRLYQIEAELNAINASAAFMLDGPDDAETPS